MPMLFHPNLFEDVFTDTEDIFGRFKEAVPYNVVQKKDTDGNVISTCVEIALAGYDKDDIKIHVIGDELLIHVNKVQNGLNEGSESYVHKGISQRSLELKFKLSGVADGENIKSVFKNGLLNVVVPACKAKTIDVKVE